MVPLVLKEIGAVSLPGRRRVGRRWPHRGRCCGGGWLHGQVVELISKRTKGAVIVAAIRGQRGERAA